MRETVIRTYEYDAAGQVIREVTVVENEDPGAGSLGETIRTYLDAALERLQRDEIKLYLNGAAVARATKDGGYRA